MRDPYQAIAGWYDRIFEPMNRGLWEIGLALYPPREGMEVLDIGCGTGAHLERYRRAGCAIHGIDLSPAMVRVAREKLGPQADIRLGSATDMPYPDRRFDLALASTVLHEMDPEVRGEVLREAGRVLKRDGRMLIIDFHPGTPRGVRGFASKAVITVSERLAGRVHYHNYRQFMATGGVPALATSAPLRMEEQKIVSGGMIGLYLLINDL